MNDETYSENKDRVFIKSHKEVKLKRNKLLKEVSTPLGTVRIVFENTEKNNRTNLYPNYENKTKNSALKYSPVLTTDGKIALLYKGNTDNEKKYESINSTIKIFNTEMPLKNNLYVRKKSNDSFTSISNSIIHTKNHTLNKFKKNNIDDMKVHKNYMKDDLLILKSHSLKNPIKQKNNNNSKDDFNLAIIPIFDIDLERKILSKMSKSHHNHNHYKYPSNVHKFMQTMIGLAALFTCFFVSACYLRRRIIRNLRLLFW